MRSRHQSEPVSFPGHGAYYHIAAEYTGDIALRPSVKTIFLCKSPAVRGFYTKKS
jgi:hypothetical protein